MEIGEAGIEDIDLNPKSRDDIPVLLMGLQHLYRNEETREALFVLLDQHVLPNKDLQNRHSRMKLWKILVMGVLKQGLGCDYDHLHELVNEHKTLQKFLGNSSIDENVQYQRQTVIDNIKLLGPELLVEVNRLLVESGHRVARKKAWRAVAKSL